MFGNIKSKATTSKSRGTSKRKVELTRTTAFLAALVAEGLRLTYGALADAAEELGEHTATGLSAGQRGSALVKSLPVELQPHICRANGSYAKGTEWDTEVPSNLRQRAYVRPEVVQDYVQAFVAATSEAESEEITPEEEPAETVDFDPETGEPITNPEA